MTETEAWIPELATNVAAATQKQQQKQQQGQQVAEGASMEACMDITIDWPGLARRALWDVTVRTPSCAKPKDASLVGADDKRRRYGDDWVEAISISTRGRLDERSRRAIETVAADSRMWGKKTLGQAPGIRSARLRLAMEAAVLRATADAALLSLGSHNAEILGWAGMRAAKRPAGAARASASEGSKAGLEPTVLDELLLCRIDEEEEGGRLEQAAAAEAQGDQDNGHDDFGFDFDVEV